MIALLATAFFALTIQEPTGDQSRVCVVVLSDNSGEADTALAAASRHCRAGDVVDFYDRSDFALTDYNVARLCDLRFPVRMNSTRGVTAAFTCVFSGGVRPSVRAPA